VRLQETPVDKLQVCFSGAHGLSLALWSQSIGKDGGYQDAHEAQGYRKLVEGITRNES
jgi:hypothetical protein